MRTDKFICNLIQLLGGYTRFNVATNLGKRFAYQNVVLTEQLYLFVCLQIYHLRLCAKLLSATLNASGLHQTVIVTIQKVAFNLLESVKNYTYHDQQ